MTYINGITFSTFLGLTILGAVLFIGFALYRRLVLPVIVLKGAEPRHQKNVDRVEIICWIIYTTIVIYFALMDSLFVTTVLIALIGLAFFGFWKNFFSGIILKFGDKIRLNDSITVNGISGKITNFGSRALRLTNQVGEEILLPYVLIDKEIKIEQKSKPAKLLKTYLLEDTTGRTKQSISSAIFSNPWIIISSPISIAMKEEEATLSFYVLNNEFFEKAKKRLLKDLAE